MYFAFSYCPWGSHCKNTGMSCPFLLQWTTFCQNSSLWPVCMAWLIASLSYASHFAMTRLWSMKGLVDLQCVDFRCRTKYSVSFFFQIILHYMWLQDQFSSVAQSCLTLCDPMDCSMPDFPVHHQLPEFTQTHVRWVRDAIQPSHPLSTPSPPAFNLSLHQGLFQWVSYSDQVAKVLEFQLQHQSFQWTPRTDFL